MAPRGRRCAALCDQLLQRRERPGREGRQPRNGLAALGHIERLAGLDAAQIDRQVLSQLPHPDLRGLLTFAHVAHGSTSLSPPATTEATSDGVATLGAMDLHVIGPLPSPAERAAVDAVLGPAESAWRGGERNPLVEGHSARGGHEARSRGELLLTALPAVQSRRAVG